MGAKSISGIFQLGIDILGSVRDATTKTILFLTGDNNSEWGETDNVESWQHVGFASRPTNPDPQRAATQGVTLRRGDHDICIATRDLRGQELAGELGPGETCLYAAGADGTSQGRIIIKSNSSVNIYTSASAGGTGMGIGVDPTTDTISILNAKGFGVVVNEDGISITAGKSAIQLGGDGKMSIVGQGIVQIDGTRINIGSVIAPLVNSALVGPTGLQGVASTKVSIEL